MWLASENGLQLSQRNDHAVFISGNYKTVLAANCLCKTNKGSGLECPASEMTYTVSSGALNSTPSPASVEVSVKINVSLLCRSYV